MAATRQRSQAAPAQPTRSPAAARARAVDERRNLFDVSGIADVAVVRAEPQIDRHDQPDIDRAGRQRPAKIVPARAEIQHSDVVHGAGSDDRVRRPECPEHQQGRSGRQRRLNEGLQRQRAGPEIQRRSRPAPACHQSQRRHQPVEVADLQRQPGAQIKAVPVPPHIVGKPVANGERGERAAQCRFGISLQSPAGQARRGDQQRANNKSERMRPAIGSKNIPCARRIHRSPGYWRAAENRATSTRTKLLRFCDV